MSAVVEIPTPNDTYQSSAQTYNHHSPTNIPERPLWKDLCLEFCGTFLFVYISIAGVNQVVLSSTGIIDQFHIALCFALGLSSGVIVAGKSGGHLNPAVSATVFLTDPDFGFTRLIGYMFAQTCAGFAAGLLVLSVYYSWINDLPESNTLIGSFGTLKNSHNSLFASILDQFIGSALLMFGIVTTPDSWSKPLTVGAVLGGLGLFQGTNGFAFNLARDFGPRLASAIVFGSDAFTAVDSWVWVPAIVPFFGVFFGWVCAVLLKRL